MIISDAKMQTQIIINMQPKLEFINVSPPSVFVDVFELIMREGLLGKETCGVCERFWRQV